MFHTWLVKIAKIDAASKPSRLPGNRAMNMRRVERGASSGRWRGSSDTEGLIARGLEGGEKLHANEIQAGEASLA